MGHERLQLVTEQGISESELLHSTKGNLQTVAMMAAYTRAAANDERIRQLALRITSGQPGHHFRAQADALFRYVRDEVEYRRDPKGRERIQSAPYTLLRKQRVGDCGDKAVAFAGMCGAIGLTSRYVLLSYKLPAFQHVFIVTNIDGAWIPFDPTNEEEDSGWKSKGLKELTYGIFGADANQIAGFKNAFKKIGKGLKKVGKVAIPIAAGFIPGLGGVASQGADALLNKGGGQQQEQQPQYQPQPEAAPPPQLRPSPPNNDMFGGISPVVLLAGLGLLLFLKR
jgi:hypothetical protein